MTAVPDEADAHRPVRGHYTSADLERRAAEGPKSAVLPIADGIVDRSAFARDRARILHSGSFRRLAGKTQVVTPGDGAVPRTRLTHSLEVAQIARDIGEQLGCDADLVDLAGLAHDIGHPPFGHNGEAALNEIADSAGGFEANAQNLRLLTRLEPKVIGPDGECDGLNLTRASLDAVIKYPWRRPAAGGKFGVYDDDLDVFGWIRIAAPADRARSIESQVMDWADDVAYSVHDVEDGVIAGRVDLVRLSSDPDERLAVATAAAAAYSTESAPDLATVLADLLRLPAIASRIGLPPGMAAASALKQLTSELTGRFVTGAVAQTRATFGPEPLTRYAADLDVPRLLAAEVAVLKAIAFHYVMNDPAHRARKMRQQQLLAELVAGIQDRGAAALDPTFVGFYQAAADDRARLRVVVDQVSLLTDAQAVARHRQLLDESLY
ncbi:MAG: deoxyguanosinetriphosphate triphosphohydrolase [Actinobacteria bacterium 69-20]|nr:deoxyguanosinetriphosphate triphosphohydrolase [Actinomycetota bacterium]OJV30178.1 MAG: deoxyguanosinetriphosphate triphosphohydrolase [Actinobacteria bacterium 69-20]